jgi:hypothetical protein
MGYPPAGMVWVYAGMAHRWLHDSLLDEAELRHLGRALEDEPEPVQEASQMPFMVLPVSALRRGKIRGHAAMPGTGPESESCGTCAHACVKSLVKNYWKCGLSKARWTGGRATDVRKSDAACSKWSAKS